MKNQTLGVVITSILEILVGILLLIDPVSFTAAIAVLAGIALCAAGIYSVILYFRTEAQTAARGSNLTLGIGALLLGGYLLCNSGVIVALAPVLTIVYGLVILAVGISKVQTTVDMLRLKRQRWYLGALTAAVTLICAAVILLNPFATTDMLWMFMGITLIVEAALDLVMAIFGRKLRPEPVEGTAEDASEEETTEEETKEEV